MSIFDNLETSNSFAHLPDVFYSRVKPEPLDNARIISSNEEVAAILGWSEKELGSDDFLNMMAGKQLPPACEPIATVYSGHQFGHYNPQLGDGRAMIIAEVETDNGPWELQLKGSGKTPYSRQGDGRAVLRSTIREYLCSQAMQGLNIPSTLALAIVDSDTPVVRETMETGASLLRMAPSHVRFGHFEYFFYTRQHEALRQLADFIIEKHFSYIAKLDDDERYQTWFTLIVERTAKLLAQWQVNGFSHGVMNTDNMSILGLTIDYGPFGFMDDFNPAYICNHSDHTGRYAYNQQPSIALWNLNALAHALSGLIDREGLKAALQTYEPVFLEEFERLMRLKIGLQEEKEGDTEMISELLVFLANEQLDYTLFFRYFSRDDESVFQLVKDRKSLEAWFTGYAKRAELEQGDARFRKGLMLANNPKYILRNYLAQQAIEQAGKKDYSMLNQLLHILKTPFDEHHEFEDYAKPTPDWGKNLVISCSS